jgi:hypothetical protein
MIYSIFIILFSLLDPTQPLIKPVQGEFSPGIERPECEADHLYPSSTYFKPGIAQSV